MNNHHRLHDVQLAVCYHIVNLCRRYNVRTSDIDYKGMAGVRRHYHILCEIAAAVQMAKTCGFYVAVARDIFSGEYTAVSVWETFYDTKITKAVTPDNNNRLWVYATHPHGTWGDLRNITGARTANLAFTGMYEP